MLLHLHIRDFAIVPALEQEFGAGFTAISGETGAGKSILVDALGLLLGARSDASWVRAGAERAELAAAFTVADNTAARQWLAEQELMDAGDECLLRRSIAAGGRSRAWINGTPVPIGQLAQLGNLLVEVHGQNEHVRLASARAQRAMLDRTGDYDAELDATASAFDRWRERSERLEALAEGAALPPSELEFVQFQLRELEGFDLEPEAIERLEKDHRLLSSAGALIEALQRCEALLDAEEGGATARLQEALALVEPYADLRPELAEARTMLDESLINARESVSALSAAAAGVDLDTDRLRETESRLAALGDLARKHGVDFEALGGVRDDLAERLDRASRFDELRAELEGEVADALARYRDAAAALAARRQAHAAALADRVGQLMGELGMAGGVFDIAVKHDEAADPAAAGTDRVDMRVSANPGIAPAPLAKVASGGELSRISLALKVATADSGARTQVFDEIDAGVGGDTANAVGRLLSRVAAGGQALCVTHLAQVAVRADRQLKVTKQASQDTTRVGAEVLAADERVEEIARMLGGKVSEQSRAHARELLGAG